MKMHKYILHHIKCSQALYKIDQCESSTMPFESRIDNSLLCIIKHMYFNTQIQFSLMYYYTHVLQYTNTSNFSSYEHNSEMKNLTNVPTVIVFEGCVNTTLVRTVVGLETL